MFSSLPFGCMFFMVMGAGTLLSVSSVHWLGIWAGLEINLIGFLPVLVYQKSTSESESAVKYFIIQALGSSLLMLGSLMSFSATFTWDLFSGVKGFEILGLVFLFSGLCTKLGLFPFHYWLPSVMAGLPWISCMLLATWQKLAPLFLMMCLLESASAYILVFMVCMISAGSSLVGGLGGMNQTQIRALLAYSSIGHLGWLMFSSLHSEWATKTYLFIYILISFSLFFSLWFVDFNNMSNIGNLKILSSGHVSILILLLSLGGLPPLLGFVSKWLVISAGSMGPWSVVIFLLILGSLMSLFYYLSLLFSIFLGGLKTYSFVGVKSSKNSVLVIMLVMNIVGGAMMLMSGLMSSL